MSRKKISDKVSNSITKAADEALKKMGVDPFEALKGDTKKSTNKSTKEKSDKASEPVNEILANEPYRIRAVVDWCDEAKKAGILSVVQIPDRILIDNDYSLKAIGDYISDITGFSHNGFILEWPPHHKDIDEFCQWELEKAKLNGVPDYDFDFRESYKKGDEIYVVRYYPNLNIKQKLKCKVRTVYPRMIVANLVNKECLCIGYNEKDNIFRHYGEANKFYDSINAVSEEEAEKAKAAKRKKQKEEAKEGNDESFEDTSDEAAAE